MIRKRIISILMCFVFMVMTLMSTSNTMTASAKAPITVKPTIPIVTFVLKPLGEYVAGSKINYKVTTKTSSVTTKYQYSAKLYNLDTNKKEMDIVPYGQATIGSNIVSQSFVIKNPGNYRLAVYVKVNGTKGLVNNSYDNYVTNDFKVVKLSNITRSLVSVAPIVVSTDASSTYILPKTVNGNMSDGSLKQYGVIWNKPANTTTPGAFTFTGSLKDLDTSKIVKNLSAKLSLKVNPLPVFNTISVSVDARTQYTLPATVDVKIIGGAVKKYGVTWNNKANTEIPGIYNFIGTIKELSTSAIVKKATQKLTLKVNAIPVVDPIIDSADLNTAYTLPTQVSAKMPDGTIKQYGVTWDKKAITTTPGAFSFTGTIKDPATSKVVKNVNPKLSLIVNIIPKLDPIVAAVDENANYTLPSVVNGKMPDGTIKQYGVMWDKPAITSTPGAFTFTGKLTDPVTNTTLKTVNQVLTLTVREVPIIDPISVNVSQGAQFILPPKVNGKMFDGSIKEYNVTWDKQADTTTVGSFTFVGTIRDENTSIIVPNITAKLTLNVNSLQLQVLSATVATAQSFKIAFNKQVDNTKCNITASMNGISIPLNTIWNSDNKSVLLSSSSDLVFGTYILKINGISIPTDTFQVEVKAPTLTSVSIPNAYLTPNVPAARIMINGKDQYGCDMDVATSDFVWVITDTTSKIALIGTTTASNFLTVPTNNSGVKIGDKISVYCIGQTDTSINTTSILEVNTKGIDNLTLKDPVLQAGDKRLTVKNVATYYEIPYIATQNYILNGTPTVATAVFDDKAESSMAQTATLNNYMFITDNSDILSNIKVVNGKLYIQIAANKSGTVKLMASQISDAGQATSPSCTLTINIAGALLPNSLTIEDSKTVLAAGGSVNKIPIVVYDQYGEVIAPDAFVRSNFSDFTILSSNPNVASAVFGSDGKTLDVTPIAAGVSNITIVNRNSGKSIVYPAVVNPPSIVKDFTASLDYTALMKGAIAKLNLTTLDQYGNKLTTAPSTYKYSIVPANGTTNVSVSANIVLVSASGAQPIAITAITPGVKENITINLYNDINNNNFIDPNEIIKQFVLSVNIISANEQLIYSVNPVNTIYAAVSQDRNNSGLNLDAYGAIQNQNNKNASYAQKLSLNIMRTDGTPVAYLANPITSLSATLNSSVIDYMDKLGNDFVLVGRQWSDTDLTKDANILVNYIDNTGAARMINTRVTVSKENLKAAKIRFMMNTGKDNDVTNDVEAQSNTITISSLDFNALNGKRLIENQNLTGYPCYFEVDDQYGVSSMNPVGFAVIGKQSALGTFTMDDNGVITTSKFVSGDSVTISAVDTEGHTLLITLKIQ